MPGLTAAEVRAAIDRFGIEGRFLDHRPLSRGHIHDTFVSRWQVDAEVRQFIHQRVNNAVFPDLHVLMDNIHAVSEHMVARLGEHGADGFEPLRLVPTRAGETFTATSTGAWRTYVFIEDTASYDRCQGPDQAFEAARAFGWFQAQLLDLPCTRLSATLHRFFDSRFRYQQFTTALAQAPVERQQRASKAIAFAVERRSMVEVIEDRLESGAMPTRIVHGDTKLNNILFDNRTGKAKGIVDLDTCMPGYSLYDFGDLVRFTAATSAEDETDLTLVGTDPVIYRALAEGYRSSAGCFLSATEVELMPFAARLVTLTIGLRFLADFLAGDRYFKVARRDHNLERARVQFGMVEHMERHASRLA